MLIVLLRKLIAECYLINSVKTCLSSSKRSVSILYLKNKFKRIEKRAVSIILPDCDLKGYKITITIFVERFFSSIENNGDHKLRESGFETNGCPVARGM